MTEKKKILVRKFVSFGIFLGITALIIFEMSTGFFSYLGWKPVQVENMTFKVPGHWQMEEIDGLTCFTNGKEEGERIYYMIEYVDTEAGNKRFGKFHFVNYLYGTVYSNGGRYGTEYIVFVDSNQENKEVVWFGLGATFVSWDESVTERVVSKIAKSHKYK